MLNRKNFSMAVDPKTHADSQANLKKKNGDGRVRQPNFNTYYVDAQYELS